MVSRYLLTIVLVLNTLALFTFPSIEALPTIGVSELRPSNLGHASRSTTYVRNPSKRQKQDDTEDEEGTQTAEGAAGAVAPAGGTYLTNTAQNIGTILGGLVTRNVSDVLTGGTQFIPPGDLRLGVDSIVQNALIPTVERVSHLVGESIQSRLNQTTTTPIPGPSTQVPTTTASSGGFNPFKLIQDRLQGVGESGDSNPLKAIQNRLESFFGGGSSSSSADSEKNVQPTSNSKYYYANRPIPGVNDISSNLHQSQSLNGIRNTIQNPAGNSHILSNLEYNNNILNNLQNNNNHILSNLQYNNNILTNLQSNNNQILSSIQGSNINIPSNIHRSPSASNLHLQNSNHNIRNSIYGQGGSNILSGIQSSNIPTNIQSSDIISSIQSSDSFRNGIDNTDPNRFREELPFAIPSSATKNQNIPSSPI